MTGAFELWETSIVGYIRIVQAAWDNFMASLRMGMGVLGALTGFGTYRPTPQESRDLSASDAGVKAAEGKLQGLLMGSRVKAIASASLTGYGGDLAAAVDKSAGSPGAPPDQTLQNFNEQAARQVHQLRIGMIEDEQTRELAAIALKYDTEREEAEKAGGDVALVNQARSLETAQTIRKFQEQHEQAMAQLQEQGIVDNEEREIASINRVYDERIRQAKEAAADTQAIEEEKAAAVHNVQQQYDRQRAQTNKDAQYELRRLQIERDLRGPEREHALLELERKQALDRESDPATRTGVDVDTLNKIFDAKEAIADMKAGGAVGTFNGAAASSMFGGGGPMNQVAQHTRQSAASLKAIEKKLDNRRNGGMFFD
ncbi:MAG TPA: hypothetical protein VH253_06360 [Phycisphaerae bacterium]|nr:hypothetical protein [Phycisphaerae bacterium]